MEKLQKFGKDKKGLRYYKYKLIKSRLWAKFQNALEFNLSTRNKRSYIGRAKETPQKQKWIVRYRNSFLANKFRHKCKCDSCVLGRKLSSIKEAHRMQDELREYLRNGQIFD